MNSPVTEIRSVPAVAVGGASSAATRAPAPPAYIQGTTLLYPVIGCPVAQVQAPMLYNALFSATGIDVAVVPVEISPADYPSVLRALFRAHNVPGAMITIPHKSPTVALLDSCSDAVRIAGACNAVVRRADGSLHGDLFDGLGLVRAVTHQGLRVAGARCLVVGSGGAGAAIAAALATAGAATVQVSDFLPSQSAALAARLGQHFPNVDVRAGDAAPDGFSLVVNATPLGMRDDDALPIDVSRLAPSTFVAEIVMKRDITPLVAAARGLGCRTMLGREMLQAQMPLYLEFFGLDRASAAPGSRDHANDRDGATAAGG